MDTEEFINWLIDELKQRDWSQADLARAAGVSRGSIGNIIRGERQPGPDLLNSIASAFGLPPEFVFRKAGVLPENQQEPEGWEEFKWVLKHLNQKDREELLAIARLKMEMEEKRGKDHNAAGQQRSALP